MLRARQKTGSCTAAHGEGTGTAAAREEKKQVRVFAIVVDRSGSHHREHEESRFSESQFGAVCNHGLSIRCHCDLPSEAEHTWCLPGTLRGLLFGWGVLGGGGQQMTRRASTPMPIIQNPTPCILIRRIYSFGKNWPIIFEIRSKERGNCLYTFSVRILCCACARRTNVRATRPASRDEQTITEAPVLLGCASGKAMGKATKGKPAKSSQDATMHTLGVGTKKSRDQMRWVPLWETLEFCVL